MTRRYRSIEVGTTEYLSVTVTSDVELDAQDVALSFDNVTWLTAAWVGTASTRRQAHVLIDPANTPTPGTHPVFVRIDDGTEVPVFRAEGQVIVR